MARILGIDFGKKRIGLAISDELGITAQGIGVYETKSERKNFAFLKDLIEKYRINRIVVGLPLDKEGKIEKDYWVVNFIKKLKKEIKIPVDTRDERFTTREAERLLLQADLSRKKRKRVIDKLSAQIILQGYLDYLNQKLNIKNQKYISKT